MKKMLKWIFFICVNYYIFFVIKFLLLIVWIKKLNYFFVIFYIKNKKMYDFCFIILYGMFLMVGGFMGYFKKGSIVFFVGGVGIGFFVFFVGFIIFKVFEKKKKFFVFVVVF